MPALAQADTSAKRLGDHERIEAERVLVDAAVGLRQRRRLAVGDHDDLPHVLALLLEDPAREPQAFAGVGVVRARRARGRARAAESPRRESWNSTACSVSPGYCVRIRCDSAIATRLAGREAVLAVEDHAVAAVEHQHRGARALVLALRDHQVLVVDVDAVTPGLPVGDRPAIAVRVLLRALHRIEDRRGRRRGSCVSPNS